MNRSNRHLVHHLTPVVVATLLAVGCADRDPGGTEGRAAGSARNPGDERAPIPRLASLSPAITRALADLGLGDSVIGRTPFCAAVAQDVPIVGDQQHVDLERLVRLEPTHVLRQTLATDTGAGLEELAARQGWQVAEWRLDDVDDVIRLVTDLPEVVAPDDTALRARSNALVDLLNACVTPTPPAESARVWTGRTLLVCGLDPLTVFGRDTFLHEMLVARGARNAAGTSGWSTLSMEDVTRLEPDAIILVRERRRALGVEMQQLLGPLARLDVPAVRTGRLAILDDPDAFLPSTGLPGVADRLAEILERFAREPAGRPLPKATAP